MASPIGRYANEFYIAMAYFRLGDHAQGRTCYEQACKAWSDGGNREQHDTRIRAEAEQLLGIEPTPRLEDEKIQPELENRTELKHETP